MYATTTIKGMGHFDTWFGTHQKIDRTARRHLGRLLADPVFPRGKEIVRFEGLDGPDGIKRKTPAKDEPWHYYDPEDANDKQILEIIQGHYMELVGALKADNLTRAAFEAAWLSHAIVDGLTPAHHYPYEEELVKLRGGKGIETRTSPKDKIIMPGATIPKQLNNNWKMWGDKGLLATHFAFEWGVAAMILPMRLTRAMPTEADMEWVLRNGVTELFQHRAQSVADLHMYKQFYASAWTPKLAKQVRTVLAPCIVSTVTLAWYAALHEASRA